MKISVIVPIYKGEKYIQPVYEMVRKSVSALSNEHCVEIIYVNDYPENDIKNYVEALQENEKLAIKLVTNQENSGIHFSRIAGLNVATGEYIMFFDQDDTITDNYFESQIKHVKKDTDVLVGNGIAQYPDYDKLLYRYFIMQWTAKYLWFYAKFDSRIISPGQCLIRKSSIPAEWYDNIMKNNGSDDYFLWLMMLSRGAHFTINRDVLYTHVYTSSNASLDLEKMRASVNEIIAINERIKVIKPSAINPIKERNTEGYKKPLLVRMVESINKVKGD